jgi:TFIIF-interacting CTD phosphatase-like protein
MDRKLLVVLDLDETLVCSHILPRSQPSPVDSGKSDTKDGGDDAFLAQDNDGDRYWVRKRPGLDAFLKSCDQHFQLAVWSASSAAYVRIIVERLFAPLNIVLQFAWTGERTCVQWNSWQSGQVVIKPLSKVWRSPLGKRQKWNRTNTVVVDNTPSTYSRNYGNAIRIETWTGDREDRELERVLQTLLAKQARGPIRTDCPRSPVPQALRRLIED